MPRRSRVEMVADVLEAVASHPGAPATRLATYANMPYDRFSRLLRELMGKGLVEEDPLGGYRLTGKGRMLLAELRRLRRLLEDMGLDIL